MKTKRSQMLPKGYAVEKRRFEILLWRAAGDYKGMPTHAKLAGRGFQTMEEAIEAAWAWAHAEGNEDEIQT